MQPRSSAPVCPGILKKQRWCLRCGEKHSLCIWKFGVLVCSFCFKTLHKEVFPEGWKELCLPFSLWYHSVLPCSSLTTLSSLMLICLHLPWVVPAPEGKASVTEASFHYSDQCPLKLARGLRATLTNGSNTHVLAAVTDRWNRNSIQCVDAQPEQEGTFWHMPPCVFVKDRDFMLSH